MPLHAVGIAFRAGFVEPMLCVAVKEIARLRERCLPEALGEGVIYGRSASLNGPHCYAFAGDPVSIGVIAGRALYGSSSTCVVNRSSGVCSGVWRKQG